MIAKRRIPFSLILRIEGKSILFFTILACTVHLTHKTEYHLSLPFGFVVTIGTAVAILLGFKNNAAYGRWWEASQIWEGIVGKSRALGMQLLAFVGRDAPEALHELVRRHLAFANVLRLQLRGQDTTAELERWLGEEERARISTADNRATLLLTAQGERFNQLRADNTIEEFQVYPLLGTIAELFALQGKAERIKKIPLMRHYAFFTTVFVWIFILMLPFAFGSIAHGWEMVPLVVLISTVFAMLDRAGTFTEDPFENEINDVPMSAICRRIEIDMMQQVGMEPVPDPLEPDERGVLM